MQALTAHAQAMNALLQQIAVAQLKLAAAQNESKNNLNALRKLADGMIRKPPELGA